MGSANWATAEAARRVRVAEQALDALILKVMVSPHKTLTAIASLALAASLAASLAGCGGKAQDYVFEAEKAELSAACMGETGPEYSRRCSPGR